ncbi:non-functional pseudokinase ZED1-like isoform X2 [Pistacia vera]|nr:non-functional pseudokinase ZED1-like isoform X2 [Pistacia vera]
MVSCLKVCKYQKNTDRKQRKALMLENGKLLLEKLIVTCNGKSNPIRGFSIEELKTATNNYAQKNIISIGGGYTLFRGFLQNRQVSIMKFRVRGPSKHCLWLNNVVFTSQMRHKNILKLIGCCLETQLPILVFDDVKYGTSPFFEPLLLRHRIKIAMEIANAVTYLHIGFSRPIVFRDINSSHILFDEDYVPKLFNFSLSEFIPEGETHVRGIVVGTSAHLAPEYLYTGDFNEKCDVYNYGVLLLELLTGKRLHDILAHFEFCSVHSVKDRLQEYIDNNRFNEIANCKFAGDGLCHGNEQHLQAFLELAFTCLSDSEEDRPNMIDVAKQLRQMHQSS